MTVAAMTRFCRTRCRARRDRRTTAVRVARSSRAGTSPTAVSQHLSNLRLAGLVTNRREGTFVFYAVADHHIGELVRQAPLPRRPPDRSGRATP